MPDVDSVVSFDVWGAAPTMNPPATIGSGAPLSSGAVILTPAPTSPRKYQPPNSAGPDVASGRDGIGGRSAARAHPERTAAAPVRASRLSLAMTTVTSLNAGRPGPRTQKRGKRVTPAVNAGLTLTICDDREEPDTLTSRPGVSSGLASRRSDRPPDRLGERR